jgi:hypothetical protein
MVRLIQRALKLLYLTNGNDIGVGMQNPLKIGLLNLLIALVGGVSAQGIYDANGQYRGYSQTSPSGVTTIYTPSGQSLGSSQVDSRQTNYYTPNGGFLGTNTATPASMQPNTTINTPRQAPQAPVMKGW